MNETLPLTADQVVSIEYEFVTQIVFASLTRIPTPSRTKDDEHADHQRAFAVFDRIDSEMFVHNDLGLIFRVTASAFASGNPVELSALGTAIENHIDSTDATMGTWNEVAPDIWQSLYLEPRADDVEREFRRRQFRDMLVKGASMLNEVHGLDGGQQLAGTMASQLIELYAGKGRGPRNHYPTSNEVVDELLQRAVTGEERGIRFPWPKLEEYCGPMIPGECIGITAYSGQGKSLFSSNMFWELAFAGINVVAFPTEMMFQWVERGIARNADVSQWRAEKGRWRDPEGESEFIRYREALEEVRKMDNWRIVARPNITPAEVAMSMRILRKNWPGERVVFFVDHMHRLDYGGEKSDEAVGDATKLFKNISQDDGNLLPILLFQPKKPEGGKEPYGPTGGHRIRGHSSVWNELDVHLCPWRAVVETVTNQADKTTQGTVRARLDRHGLPMLRSPTVSMADRKWDDENFHIKIDKRRTGGAGPNVVLPINPVSGRIHVPPTPG